MLWRRIQVDASEFGRPFISLLGIQFLDRESLRNGSVLSVWGKGELVHLDPSEITESEDKRAVHEQSMVPKKSLLKVIEFDLERILEEQDTHDLCCPNCNSCITKRVILQKRKWSVREIQHDVPSKKVHEEQQYDAERLDTASVSGEMTNLADAPEPDVFRCLSCFSFFIPTGIPSIIEGKQIREPGGAELGTSATLPQYNHSVILNGYSYFVGGQEMANDFQINEQNIGTM
ncbi:unnamed protein product, partial [Musa acuminata subsp. burmannicoides]